MFNVYKCKQTASSIVHFLVFVYIDFVSFITFWMNTFPTFEEEPWPGWSCCHITRRSEVRVVESTSYKSKGRWSTVAPGYHFFFQLQLLSVLEKKTFVGKKPKEII